MLKPDESNDKKPESDPNSPPEVMETLFVPDTEEEEKHRTDVSDSHSVPSHPVWPDRTIAVSIASPRPAPCTVE